MRTATAALDAGIGLGNRSVVGVCQGGAMAGDEIRVVLRGPHSRLGQVRARDVGRLVLGLEAALAAAAYVALGKPRRSVTGRHVVVVEAATCLTMRQLSDHPVTAIMALPVLVPDGADTFDIEVDDLAGAALDHLMAVPQLPEKQVDRAVARSLSELATSLGVGERHDALTLHSKRPRDSGVTELRLDVGLHLRMHRVAEAPTEQRSVGTLTGSLREVDFDRRTARLQTASGTNVAVTFEAAMADAIQDALRQQVHFEGVVSFDVATSAVRRVELRRISRAEPLPFTLDGLDQGPGDGAPTDSRNVVSEKNAPPVAPHPPRSSALQFSAPEGPATAMPIPPSS